MIKFTELQVQNGRLVVVAEVSEEQYYTNVYIDEVIIDTQDTFNTTGPSANPIYSAIISGNQKKVTLSLSSTDLNNVGVDNTMFFVYIKVKGTPSPNTPCGGDNEYTLGVTFSLCPIYNATMGYIKEINNTCDIPKNFIDMILRFKAIQYSVESGHFLDAIKYYNQFFRNVNVRGAVKKCGCHG